MSNRWKIMASLFLALEVAGAASDVQVFNWSFRDVYPKETLKTPQSLSWPQASTLFLREQIRTNLADLVLNLSNTNVLTVWEVAAWTNAATVYFAATGTVESASSNQVSFRVSPQDSNLATGRYLGFVRSMALSGTNLVDNGVLAHQEVIVTWSPDSRHYAIKGPLSYSVAGDGTNDTVSFDEVEEIVGSGSNQLAVGNHTHPDLELSIASKANVIHGHSAADITSGVFSTARLPSEVSQLGQSIDQGEASAAANTAWTQQMHYITQVGTGSLSATTTTNAAGNVVTTVINGPGPASSSGGTVSATNQTVPAAIGSIGGAWTINYSAGAVQYMTVTSAVTSATITGLMAGASGDLTLYIANPSGFSVTWPASGFDWLGGNVGTFKTNGATRFICSTLSNATTAARVDGP